MFTPEEREATAQRISRAAIPRSLGPEALWRALEAATHGLIAELRRGDTAVAEKLARPLLDVVRQGR